MTPRASALAGPAAPGAQDVIAALLTSPEPGMLAVIAGSEGSSYRATGTMMAITDAATSVGSLSGGCIDADIRAQAHRLSQRSGPLMLRYGSGSPFADIRMPCGGSLDVLIVPAPDRGVLGRLHEARERRQPAALAIDIASGGLSVVPPVPTARLVDRLVVALPPPRRFVVVGTGSEVSALVRLVVATDQGCTLLSPDATCLTEAAAMGCQTYLLTSPRLPEKVRIDPWTAVVLLFHEHAWEPPILAQVLSGPALYVGAQGSRAAAHKRRGELRRMGLSETGLSRLRGPIGLVPSARDPQTLAVSVLAEIVAVPLPVRI